MIVKQMPNRLNSVPESNVYYGAFHAMHPMSFSSASISPDYIPLRKVKKKAFQKRTREEVYAQNQEDLDKMRRGEYTSSDFFFGVLTDVLEVILTK